MRIDAKLHVALSTAIVLLCCQTFAQAQTFRNLAELVKLSDQELASIDIAGLNLTCAQDLPGAEEVDVETLRKTLDRWANAVRHETNRYFHQFESNPANFQDSEGYFRILTMITILQQDFGVHFNPNRIRDVDFSRSQDLFVHGLLTRNGGTCVSMPVLYVAVGRRIGYPLNLVAAKEHLFARWDDPRTGEQFNIEATGAGLNTYPDSYYMKWPHPITETELQAGLYLRSLTPRRELADFLATRGHCLMDNKRYEEALQAYGWATDIFLPYLGFYNQAKAKVPTGRHGEEKSPPSP